jgi:hypothetical protein
VPLVLLFACAAVALAVVRVMVLLMRRPNECPRCRSGAVRRSSTHGLTASIARLFNFGMYRCRMCKVRFVLLRPAGEPVSEPVEELPFIDEVSPAAEASSRAGEAAFEGKEPSMAEGPRMSGRRSFVEARYTAEPPDVAPSPDIDIDDETETADIAAGLAPDNPADGIPGSGTRKGNGRRRRRRRSRSWFRKSLGKIALTTAGVSVLLFAVLWTPPLPVRKPQPLPPRPKSITDSTVAPQSRFVAEMEIGEASLSNISGKLRIQGVVRNKDKAAYRNVEAVFLTWDRHKIMLGLVSAEVNEVPAGASVPFQTSPVPEGTAKFELRTLEGGRQ